MHITIKINISRFIIINVTLFVDVSIESISQDEYNKIPRKLINKRSNGFKQIKQFIKKRLKKYLKFIILSMKQYNNSMTMVQKMLIIFHGKLLQKIEDETKPVLAIC